MPKKRYVGRRAGPTAVDDLEVTVLTEHGETYSLPWRLDLRNHSPTGLNAGYGGSGPAQLSLALLADHLDDDQAALRAYHDFKWVCVALLPIDDPWELTSDQIDEFLVKAARRSGA